MKIILEYPFEIKEMSAKIIYEWFEEIEKMSKVNFPDELGSLKFFTDVEMIDD